MSVAPGTIPFNIIDRSYLIAESDTENSKFFPMSIIAIVKLNEALTQERIVSALVRLNRKYPHLRLAYQLDYDNIRWKRVPDSELADYLASCVHTVLDNCSVEDCVSNAISVNNDPLSQPVNLIILDKYLMLKMHHSFGDGKFSYVLLQHILSELFGRHIDTPLSKVWWKPIWRVIWQNMRQGSHVMWQFVKSLSGYYQDYQHDVQGNSATSRIPIVSGSPMGVRFKSISADCLALLNDMKQDISLNTLLQVMIGEHLKKFNIQQEPITYTIPVDLRRYLSESDVYYPSNLASQIRITLPDTSSPVERIQILQQQISEKLQKKEPLVGIPGEWLLAMGGKKTYQAVNRDWLLKSTHNDPRVFILSNLGKLDRLFSPFEDVLAEDFPPQLVIPLMGSPPLVFSFNTLRHQGNIALTYNPQLFSSEQIDRVLGVFDSSKIHNFAKSFTE